MPGEDGETLSGLRAPHHGGLVIGAADEAAPSGLQATDLTPPLWPVRVKRHSPVSALHTMAVLSSEPLMIRAPSELQATEVTPPL